MAASETDAAARLWWALRRQWPIVANVMAVFLVLGLIAGTSGDTTPQYKAVSLVVAAELDIRPESLPRFSRAVFKAGDVADDALAATGLDIEREDLLDDNLLLEPIEDTVLLRVVGIHEDPEVAKQLADTGAASLVARLNALGPGVGEFVILEPARADPDPIPQPGPLVPLVLSLFAGAAFGLGIVGLLLALRRPILSPSEAAAVAGAPVLGTPTLPRGERHPEPTEVSGLTALLRSLLPGPEGVVVTVGVRGDRGERRKVALLLARGFSRRGKVHLVELDRGSIDLAVASPTERRNILFSREVDPTLLGGRVVIDGPTAHGIDAPQFLPANARVVLVVREGMAHRSLADAASQFLPGELTGVVFVPYVSRLSLRRPSRGATGVDAEPSAETPATTGS